MNGRGVFRWPDGKKYVGYYKEDRKNGYGVLTRYSLPTNHTRPDGSQYKGGWTDGVLGGEGVLGNASGLEVRGTFKNGL